jgi:hypothetical protein
VICLIVVGVCAKLIGPTTKNETPFPFMLYFFAIIIFGILALFCAVPLVDKLYKEAQRLDAEQPAIQKPAAERP